MIADYKIDATCFGILYFLDCFDAAVEDNDEFDAGFGSFVDNALRYAIALVVSGRYVVLYLAVEILEIAVHQCDGCRAVNVIVSIDHDSLFGPIARFIRSTALSMSGIRNGSWRSRNDG